jgi:hypothetical protein
MNPFTEGATRPSWYDVEVTFIYHHDACKHSQKRKICVVQPSLDKDWILISKNMRLQRVFFVISIDCPSCAVKGQMTILVCCRTHLYVIMIVLLQFSEANGCVNELGLLNQREMK